jgi:MYXO-CTERM domain-containing protein
VSDSNTNAQGRSDGCFALDTNIELSIVQRLANGSVMYAELSPLNPPLGRSLPPPDLGTLGHDAGGTGGSGGGGGGGSGGVDGGGGSDDGGGGKGDQPADMGPTQSQHGGCSAVGGGDPSSTMWLFVGAVIAIGWRKRSRRVIGVGLLLSLGGCAPSSAPVENTEALTGCNGMASSAIPPSGDYYLTTFGGGADTQPMACGGTADGTWYYAASKQRYGCGTHLRVCANGKCAIVAAEDYGPDVCVENAAGGPVLDASPLVAEYLYGTSSAGWSDRFPIVVDVVGGSTPLGPTTGAGADGGGTVLDLGSNAVDLGAADSGHADGNTELAPDLSSVGDDVGMHGTQPPRGGGCSTAGATSSLPDSSLLTLSLLLMIGWLRKRRTDS